MTTEDKKPSELILSRLPLGGGMFELRTDPVALADYLDAEQERRAKFEQDVVERLAKLEWEPEPPSTRYGRCDRCGVPLGKVFKDVGGKRWCAPFCPREPA